MNTYGYVNQNPLSFIDPDGLTGNSAQRRGARRAKPKGPINPSTNSPGDYDNFPKTIALLLCAAGVSEACFPSDFFICVAARCTPECGDPYIIYLPLTNPIMQNSATKCVCIQRGFNPKFRDPFPGF